MQIRLLLKNVTNHDKNMIALKLIPVVNEEWTKGAVQVTAGIKNKNKVKLPKEFVIYTEGSVGEWKNFKNLFTKPIELDFVDDEKELRNSAIAKALEQTKKEMGVSARTKMLGTSTDTETTENTDLKDLRETLNNISNRLSKLENKS